MGECDRDLAGRNSHCGSKFITAAETIVATGPATGRPIYNALSVLRVDAPEPARLPLQLRDEDLWLRMNRQESSPNTDKMPLLGTPALLHAHLEALQTRGQRVAARRKRGGAAEEGDAFARGLDHRVDAVRAEGEQAGRDFDERCEA